MSGNGDNIRNYLNRGIYGKSNIFIIYKASQQLSLELDQLPYTLVALISAESRGGQPLTHLCKVARATLHKYL
jgi:hypothetical protein